MVLLVCLCNDLLDEKVYDFVLFEQLGDSESVVFQFVIGVYNMVIISFIVLGFYFYLINMDCDYVLGVLWVFGNVGVGNL